MDSRDSKKRQLDAAGGDLSPAKRPRLEQPAAHQAGAHGKPEQTTLWQPKPYLPKNSHALFLKDFVDPVSLDLRPPSVHRFVSEWLKSANAREKQCRSDSYLYFPEDVPIPRNLTRSAPEMPDTLDTDGFTVPLTTVPRSILLTPTDSTSNPPSSNRSPGKSLVEDPNYRFWNLTSNRIFIRTPNEEFPDNIADLVRDMGNGRKSPGPSPDQVRQDTALYNLDMEAVEEAGVGKYFLATIFPDPIQSDSIQRIERQPMAKHTIPSTARSEFKISSPIPDALYGYNRNTAFTQQFTQLISMKNDPMANARGMIYPFFVIEFKGATGNLWVATNQCVGGSVSCVNMVERLNEQLRKCKSDNIQAIDSAVFSIAMNATEARLFISWKHNKLDYYMQQVECFALQRPEDYIELRKYVRNIIDWGAGGRLKGIQNSLDSLLENGRQRVSGAVKSRQPPSDSSETSGSKKRKISASHANSSRSSSVQEQDKGVNAGDYITPQSQSRN